ncbi:MAG: 3-hydroxyacyl-CoA dehydrogenase family protein [Deltaproteobacteria bacterium]|nr:MAG: 3-hydroxyacyl-CoA dehydrogenase family protein [Deltaproteobacteria bacterium]
MGRSDIRVVSVIGAGEMGHGIAEVALLAGYKVFLRDITQEFLEKGVQRINDSLEKFLKKGKITRDEYEKIRRELLYPCTDMRKSVEQADLVIEAVPEILDLKMEIFAQMDKFAPPHALLASNTSSISITQLSKATERKDKVLGLHFFNPVVIMKLVEVVRGQYSSENTMQKGYDFCLSINKVPVRVEKDVPGFIVNRINAPTHVLRGCILDNGIATPEEIDATMERSGAPMGPCKLLDYVGLDVHYHVLQYYAKNLHPDYKPYRTLEEKIRSGHLGKKTGKGFYDWSHGKPEIDISKATDKVDPNDFLALQVNEATKLVEMGVCSLMDIDTAMVNATNMRIGPIEAAQDIDPVEMIRRLERLAEQFGKEIFLPTGSVREGRYRL